MPLDLATANDYDRQRPPHIDLGKNRCPVEGVPNWPSFDGQDFIANQEPGSIGRAARNDISDCVDTGVGDEGGTELLDREEIAKRRHGEVSRKRHNRGRQADAIHKDAVSVCYVRWPHEDGLSANRGVPAELDQMILRGGFSALFPYLQDF